MYVYEEIRDELKKYKYVIYKIKNNNFEFGIKFKGTKKELYQKLEQKYKKSKNDFYVCFKYGFHTGTKLLQGGPLSVTISTFVIIDGEVKNAFTTGPKFKYINGKVWFQRKFLEKNGWSDKYFEIMTSKLITGKVKLMPLVVNMYNVEF